MRRPSSIHQPVFVTLALSSIAIAWWAGCSPTPNLHPTTTSVSASSGSGGAGGAGTTGSAGGKGGTGGMDIGFDGGGGSVEEAGACTSTSAASHPVNLDIIFLIDQSGSMSGVKWNGTTAALKSFFFDPASANIGAGLALFPNHKAYADICIPPDYSTLDVPIDVLPMHAFALSNAIPADATLYGTPTYGALKGVLMAATAHQDLQPTHKVIVVLATDGEPNSCGLTTIDQIANLAQSARNYNGVLTYVIGVEGSVLPNLDKIAAAGGTVEAYNVTNDISDFSAKIAEIRKVALGCDFVIPPPPPGEVLDPGKVNFSYTPKGIGTPTVLPRADGLADCNGKPGWYYDSNFAPTKIVLCPASCTTVQGDIFAKVDALFGCTSVAN